MEKDRKELQISKIVSFFEKRSNQEKLVHPFTTLKIFQCFVNKKKTNKKK